MVTLTATSSKLRELNQVRSREKKTFNWKEIKSFFGVPGQEKERPEDVTIYSEMIKLNQDTSFDYFVGEFQILWMNV